MTRKTFLNNISNFSSTGYGVDSVLIPQIIDFLQEMKRTNRQLKVLDFGCSQQPYKYLFEQFDNAIEYVGLDVYDGEKVDVIYDGNKIPFEDNCFDFIFSSSVLVHIENLDNSLREIYRALKKGGVAMHVVPFAVHVHGVPFDFSRLTRYGWLSKNKKAGFKDVYMKPTDGKYCCIINILTGQINLAIIDMLKQLRKIKNDSSSKMATKSIFSGDASPESASGKKMALLYFVLKLNPINFLLGLSCLISKVFPSREMTEGKITSAYFFKTIK